MTRSALPCLVAVGLMLAACGSSVESDPDGTGGSGSESSTSTSSTSSSATTSAGGESGEGGAGGAPTCEPYDEACNCAGCDGDCTQACNFDPAWSCHEPGPPGDDEFSCGGWLNCGAQTQACVEISPVGDGCFDYFCADLPTDCLGSPTCECLTPFIDQQEFGAACAEGDGVAIQIGGFANNPPWDQPVCGVTTCEAGESCWGCAIGGSNDSYSTCALENPDPMHCSSSFTMPGGEDGAGGAG